MAQQTSQAKELKNVGYEMFIGALSVLSIFNLILSWLFRQNQDLQTVVLIMNAIFMPVFIADFAYRLLTSESKAGYFFRNFGWADLLSSLPLPQAKILRMFRLWRVIRLFREYGVQNLAHEFIDNRAGNALLTVVFLVFCVLEFGSLAVLSAESSSSDANITNATSAIWWAYVTITTVGYGDRYPVTNAGRIVGILVMTAGVGLFGTLSGFLANTFLTPPKKRWKAAEASADANNPKSRVAELRRMIEAQEQATAELRAKLDEIDKLL
jgi:voltage-gated potassium channel Kch